MKKKFLLATICFILMAFILLWLRDDATSKKNSLIFAISSEPISLDPAKTTDQMCWSIFCSLYDTLFWYNDKTHEIENRLAENYSWNSDGTELTIKLREGVLFHNGQEMTAEDAAFSVDRMANSTFARVYIVNYLSAEAVDKYVLKIKYAAPFEGALKSLAVINYVIQPKAEVEKNPDAFALHPVGTGAYKFKSRTPGVEIVFEANENYWRGAPAIKELTFRLFSDVNTAVVALEAGEADFLTHAPLTSKKQILSNSRLAWDEKPFNGPIIIFFQQAPGKMFADVNLRKAVQHAINRDDILLGAADGIGTSLYSLFLPGMYGYDEAYKAVLQDKEKAREYIKAAGYSDKNPPTLTIDTIDTAVNYKTVDIVASQLIDVGFNVVVNRMERPGYFAKIFSNHDFSLAISTFGASLPDSEYISGFSDSSQIEKGYNFSELRDPIVDRLLKDGRLEIDPVKRDVIYKNFQKYLDENALFIPLIMYGASVAYDKDLKGVEADFLFRFPIFNYSYNQL